MRIDVLAVGPVVVEAGAVLLVKDGKDPFWKFPGGRVEDADASLEDAAKREAKEELGMDVELIRTLKPTLIELPLDGKVVLVHYLAKRLSDIRPGEEVSEWAWHPIDALPDDLAPNIQPVLDELKNG